jgi:MFS transporter, DHA1 family, multidrug resistance protein
VTATPHDERLRVRARRTRRAAGVVLFLSFLDIFALLPTVGPHVAALGGGDAAIGAAVGAYSASNIPANVVGGILVDRWGRRRVLLLGLGLATAAVATYVLAATVGAFIAVRVLHGLAGGILIPAVFAAAGDRAEPGRTGRSFGRLGAVIGAAAVVAPATAGIVRQTVSTEAVFLGISAALAVAFGVAWWGVHDRVRAPGAAPTGGEQVQRAMRALLSDTTLRRALIATATLTAAVGVLAGFLPGRAEALGADPGVVGLLFTAYAVVAGAIMLSPISGRVDRGRALGTAAVGLAVLAVALGSLTIAWALWVAVVASAVFGAGYGLVFPAVTGTTSLLASDATRGRAFGLFNVAFSLGLALGPPIIGWAAEATPRVNVFAPSALLCLGVAAWLLLTSSDARATSTSKGG